LAGRRKRVVYNRLVPKAPATASRKLKPMKVLTATPLARVPWLVHGFSTRMGGFSAAYGGQALNLGFTPDDTREAVERNRAAFFKKLGAAGWGKVWLQQVHSDVIWPVQQAPEHTLVGDGLITNTPRLLLIVRTADCLPVLLADVKRRAVAALHCGWRSTLKRMAEKGVGEMRRVFGSRPEDLRVAIGPGIHRCCYTVGEEVRDAFASQFHYWESLFEESRESDDVRERYPLLFLTARAPGHSHELLPRKITLDLVLANRGQLMAAGVPAANITASPLCTACRTDLLFSHRAEKGKTGRMMSVIGIAG
jgi:YfiH family protein